MNKILSAISFLKGKRTYIVGAVIFILGGLKALGYPVPEEFITLLGGLGLVTLRAGINSKASL